MSDENDHDMSIPAFPQQAVGGETVREGMTLRDYFAGQALTGLIETHPYWPQEHHTSEAYKLADAMLAARAKRGSAAKPPQVAVCSRCNGEKQIANSEDGEPWSAWAELPPGSDIAVRMGVVKPIPCPDCCPGETKP